MNINAQHKLLQLLKQYETKFMNYFYKVMVFPFTNQDLNVNHKTTWVSLKSKLTATHYKLLITAYDYKRATFYIGPRKDQQHYHLQFVINPKGPFSYSQWYLPTEKKNGTSTKVLVTAGFQSHVIGNHSIRDKKKFLNYVDEINRHRQ